MTRARFSPNSRKDLTEILRHLTQASGHLPTARNFVTSLRQKCHELADLPGTLGVDRKEFGTGLRSTAFRNYVIFFRYTRTEFQIIRIIEGHRDIQSQFPAPQ